MAITVIYFFWKNSEILRQDAKEKEQKRKRESVLDRDRPSVLGAIRKRDLEFLWKKSLAYEDEGYLIDKALELWQRLKKMDPHGVYGKKAEAKLRPVINPKMTIEMLDKISILAETEKGE